MFVGCSINGKQLINKVFFYCREFVNKQLVKNVVNELIKYNHLNRIKC